jgi:4a-hydroxytetrahydrobiopterin dehydratase
MSCPTIGLTAEIIRQNLSDLPSWHYHDNALERVYEGQNYLDSLAKLDAIARLSESENHHPDLTLSWKKLTIRYWTHTAKGITALDFQLARQVESLLAKD